MYLRQNNTTNLPLRLFVCPFHAWINDQTVNECVIANDTPFVSLGLYFSFLLFPFLSFPLFSALCTGKLSLLLLLWVVQVVSDEIADGGEQRRKGVFGFHLKCILLCRKDAAQDRIEHTCVSSLFLSASIKSPFIIITLFAFSFHCEPCLPDLACSMDYTRKRRRSWLNTTAAWDNKRILDFENWLWSHLLYTLYRVLFFAVLPLLLQSPPPPPLSATTTVTVKRELEMQMTGKSTQKSTLGAVISFHFGKRPSLSFSTGVTAVFLCFSLSLSVCMCATQQWTNLVTQKILHLCVSVLLLLVLFLCDEEYFNTRQQTKAFHSNCPLVWLS